MKQGLAAVCVVAGLLACGKAAPASTSSVAVVDGGGEVEVKVEGVDGGSGGGGTGCAVTLESWPLEPANHVPVGTALTWESNPPSSGAHYPVWAAYQEFTTPVPRGYYVHDLEHGAVVLLYNCAHVDGSACEVIREALRQVSASLPDDPRCSGEVRVRTVITPDPLIPTPIAATAWGFVYRAECVDLVSLKNFVATHYAKAPEDSCRNGVTSF